MKESFKGTMFRLPLRNKEQAASSKLSNHYYSVEEVRSLLDEFINQAEEMILFLSSIENIKIYSREESGELTKLFELNIETNEKIQAKRKHRLLNLNDFQKTANITDFELNVKKQLIGSPETTTQWVVKSLVKASEATEEEKQIEPGAGVQWVAIATRTDSIIQHGSVYCSLPLPIRTNYPVHINANFALSSNRR